MAAITPLTPWGISPYGIQGQGVTPVALQQVYQLLQIVPQQLQALQQLEYLQQQQLQQLLQIVPAQLAQLHHLIQAVLQTQQTQQPLGQMAGAGGFAMTPWGITPQGLGAQPGQIM